MNPNHTLKDAVLTPEEIRASAAEDEWKAKRNAASLANMQRANLRANAKRAAACADAYAARVGGEV